MPDATPTPGLTVTHAIAGSPWHRLFFDSDGALDLFQLYFAAWLGLCGIAIVMTGLGRWHLPDTAWKFLQYVFLSLVIPALPTWLGKLWLASKLAAPTSLVDRSGILPGCDPDQPHP